MLERASKRPKIEKYVDQSGDSLIKKLGRCVWPQCGRTVCDSSPRFVQSMPLLGHLSIPLIFLAVLTLVSLQKRP
jgi:hypothetical protein